MPKTVAFLNKKGGVGKTSTTFHLGGELARRGLHILLVDADAQASLTQGVLGPEATEALDPSQTVAAVFDESGVAVTGDLVHATAFRNLWVLPGSEAAERWNLAEPWNETDRQFLLRDALEEVGARFDLVLIDCPPHISLWAWSALVAADGVVVPLQAEDYGAQGMKAIRKTIAHVQPRPTAGCRSWATWLPCTTRPWPFTSRTKLTCGSCIRLMSFRPPFRSPRITRKP